MLFLTSLILESLLVAPPVTFWTCGREWNVLANLSLDHWIATALKATRANYYSNQSRGKYNPNTEWHHFSTAKERQSGTILSNFTISSIYRVQGIEYLPCICTWRFDSSVFCSSSCFRSSSLVLPRRAGALTRTMARYGDSGLPGCIDNWEKWRILPEVIHPGCKDVIFVCRYPCVT